MDDLIKLKDTIIEGIKGLMQPMFSVLAAFIVYRLATTGFDQNQLFWLAVGVVGFWFGKTVGLFGNGKAPEITASSAAETTADLVKVIKNQAATINNAALDLGASVPVAVVEGKAAPVVTPAATPAASTAPADGDNPDTFLAGLENELKSDPGVK